MLSTQLENLLNNPKKKIILKCRFNLKAKHQVEFDLKHISHMIVKKLGVAKHTHDKNIICTQHGQKCKHFSAGE